MVSSEKQMDRLGRYLWTPQCTRKCILILSLQVAVKIILKKNVKGNEQMVYDELEMLQRMKHKHIVKFVDWFESRVGTHRNTSRKRSL